MENKCKNCNVEIKKGRKYCSYKCRNIYVNKNLRDYSKVSKGLSKKDKYLSNPKFCENCGNEISYEKRRNRFCSGSCSTTYSNKGRVGEKRNFSDKSIKNLRESAIKNLHGGSTNYVKKRNEYNSNPKKCLNCDTKILYRKRKNTFCSRDCRNTHLRKNLNEYQKYYREAQFKFSLNEYPKEFDFSLIEKHGWYLAKNRGNNLYGVSRDHIYSIKEGFRNGIDVDIISHPANCRLITQSKNASKSDSCDITINELKNKISEWDKKYRDKAR